MSNITVREKGKSANIQNEQGAEFLKIRVDGCVRSSGVLADWVIEHGSSAVVIELKGRHVEHGADQVSATAEMWKVHERRCQRVAGLIVGKQTPGANTAMQLKKKRFSAQFGGPLHVVNSNSSFAMEAIMSFKGPHRV